MSNIIDFNSFRSPVDLPQELTACKTWCVWRLVQMPGEKKPRKIPYYISGEARKGDQGSAPDLASLVSFERAAGAVQKGGYSGVGLAMQQSNGLVALDFDDCVYDSKGERLIDPQVKEIIEGTYSEFSPSGTGIRAFFLGSIRDRKDHNEKKQFAYGVEFFCGAGYVTLTGNRTPDCDFFGWAIEPLTDAVKTLYTQRFGSMQMALGNSSGVPGGASGAGGDADDWFMTEVKQKVGLTIVKARTLLESLSADCGYAEWISTGHSLHHEFDGSDDAMRAWMEWSKQSSEKYPGDRALEQKWRGFGSYSGPSITGAYLLRHAKDAKVMEKYEAIADWKEKIREVEDEITLREKICPAISKDARLADIERESLAQQLLDKFKTFGTKLTIAFCRKLVSSPDKLTPTVKQKRPLTEFGNCDRMLDKYGDSLMYVPEMDAWYVWTGIYWRKGTSTDIEFFAKETIRGLVAEAVDHEAELGDFFEFCKLSQQNKMVKNMVSLAGSDPRVMVPSTELDKHKGMLCVQNGVVDLKTGKLLEPDPAFRMTRVAASSYVPGALCPLFKKVLSDCFFDDKEMCDFFMRVIGYSIVGNPTEDLMVIPYGNGSNGKSTVFGTIRKVLGTYARSAAAETFVSDGVKAGGGPREDIVRLQGCRFVYVAEPDEGSELREGAIKGMTGGDAIPARAMYAKFSIEVEPTWVPFMPTNHKPVVKGNDNGIWRRLVLLPFLRNFESDEFIVKDEGLAEQLMYEAEGVLALCVLAAGAYLRDGLKQPASIKKAREEYRSQMDLLAEWLDERCELDPNYAETMQKLWLSWELFARERGLIQYVKSSIALGKRLDQRFRLVKGTNGVRSRTGLRLKTVSIDSDDWFDQPFQF